MRKEQGQLPRMVKILFIILVVLWFWYNTPALPLLRSRWDNDAQVLRVSGFIKKGVVFRMGGPIVRMQVGVRTKTPDPYRYVNSKSWEPSWFPVQRVNVAIVGVDPTNIDRVTLEFVVQTPYGMLLAGGYWEIPYTYTE